MKFILAILLSVFMTPAYCEHPITARSSMMGYEVLLKPKGEADATKVLEDDFAFLKGKGLIPDDATLFVRKTDLLGEALSGRAIVVSERLAFKPREIRLFVLAHEGSHARHDDSETRRSFIEDNVSPYASATSMMEQYRAIQPEMQKQAKQVELRADREAFLALRKAGVDARLGVITFFKVYENADTQWHPSSKERLFALLKL